MKKVFVRLLSSLAIGLVTFLWMFFLGLLLIRVFEPNVSGDDILLPVVSALFGAAFTSIVSLAVFIIVMTKRKQQEIFRKTFINTLLITTAPILLIYLFYLIQNILFKSLS